MQGPYAETDQHLKFRPGQHPPNPGVCKNCRKGIDSPSHNKYEGASDTIEMEYRKRSTYITSLHGSITPNRSHQMAGLMCTCFLIISQSFKSDDTSNKHLLAFPVCLHVALKAGTGTCKLLYSCYPHLAAFDNVDRISL
jgi:hypothetical protein